MKRDQFWACISKTLGVWKFRPSYGVLTPPSLTTSLTFHIPPHHSHLTSHPTTSLTSHITSHHICHISHQISPHLSHLTSSHSHITSLTSHINLTTTLTSDIISPHHSHLTSNVAHTTHHVSPHHWHPTSQITHISHRTSHLTTKVRELPRKMNIEEVEEPETTKIHTQNPHTPIPAKPKLRKFTYKTNMQARKYVNRDEFCPAPRSNTRPFTTTVRTPSVNLTVWGMDGEHRNPMPKEHQIDGPKLAINQILL